MAGRMRAFITGSGRRLGRQLAYAFAEHDYDLILHAHESVDGLREAEEGIRDRGADVFSVTGDLRRVADIQRMAADIRARIDMLDVLVNNAGVFPTAGFDAVTEAMWDETLAVNTKSPFFLTQALVPLLRAARGCVINIASAGGYEPWNSHIPYNVSKAGVMMLTRGMAKALAPEIRVNAVAPGVIIVDGEESIDHIPASRFPMQRYGTPDDLAAAVLFLAAGTTYITGHILPVTGGATAV
ncbi:MAG: SDR family oxidoreductase [Bacteroidota bacterium]|jgi:pteridine reductase|nr:SDR family oxidoreductase [Bacteroidota bacterium]